VYSAVLSSAAKRSLANLANSVPKSLRGNRITIIGYVGASGFTITDLSLSRARAQAVAAYLKSIGLRGFYRVDAGGAADVAGPAARYASIVLMPAASR
jgi:outer membrane protein OmpA-like peptidoglycan-associated protein